MNCNSNWSSLWFNRRHGSQATSHTKGYFDNKVLFNPHAYETSLSITYVQNATCMMYLSPAVRISCRSESDKNVMLYDSLSLSHVSPTLRMYFSRDFVPLFHQEQWNGCSQAQCPLCTGSHPTVDLLLKSIWLDRSEIKFRPIGWKTVHITILAPRS